MIPVRIDSRIGIGTNDIPDEYLVKLRVRNPAWKSHGIRPVGQLEWYQPWVTDGESVSLERGAGTALIRDMRRDGHRFVTDDRRVSVPVSWPELRSDITLRGAQAVTVSRVIRLRSGVVILPTGSGKTLAALEAARLSGERTLVIVPTQILARQWESEINSFYGMSTGDGTIGRAYGGRFTIGSIITIGLPGTLSVPNRLGALAPEIGFVIGDEVQRAAARTYHAVTAGLPARYRIGVSADPRRMDANEHVIRSVFGPTIIHRERADAERAGDVIPVELRVIRYSAPGNYIRDVAARETRLLDDWARNLVLDRIVREATGPVVVFCRTVAGVRTLVRRWTEHGLEPGTMIGPSNGPAARDEFKRCRAGLRDGTIDLVVATFSAMGVGVDVPELADAVFATPPGKSGRGFLAYNQNRGRVARRGSGDKTARVWLLWDVKQTPSMAATVADWNDGLATVPSDPKWTSWATIGSRDLLP